MRPCGELTHELTFRVQLIVGAALSRDLLQFRNLQRFFSCFLLDLGLDDCAFAQLDDGTIPTRSASSILLKKRRRVVGIYFLTCFYLSGFRPRNSDVAAFLSDLDPAVAYLLSRCLYCGDAECTMCTS